ncbi:MAG: calcium-binding protein, partial [Geminicoccaceae bacterium]
VDGWGAGLDNVRLVGATSGTTVDENSADGTIVGTVAGSDPDAGDTLSYSLADDAGGRFAIDSATGEVTVADGSLLDYETATSHDVTVRVTDEAGATYDEAFTIDVADVSERSAGPTHEGTSGNDRLDGTSGDDVMHGYGGHDDIYGGSGSDTLDGGDGEDWLFGGDDGDLIIGGEGNDDLYGEGGNDTLNGGADSDLLDGGEGRDALDGGDGHDWLFGGDGDDRIVGGEGDDTLYGQGGDDRLDGGAGEDWFFGGDGENALYGGDGDDVFFIMEAQREAHKNTVSGGKGGAWTDIIELQDSSGGSDIGDYGRDWTLALEDGSSVESSDIEEDEGWLALSDDASGSIVLRDGTEIEFTGIEHIQW